MNASLRRFIAALFNSGGMFDPMEGTGSRVIASKLSSGSYFLNRTNILPCPMKTSVA